MCIRDSTLQLVAAGLFCCLLLGASDSRSDGKITQKDWGTSISTTDEEFYPQYFEDKLRQNRLNYENSSYELITIQSLKDRINSLEKEIQQNNERFEKRIRVYPSFYYSYGSGSYGYGHRYGFGVSTWPYCRYNYYGCWY